MFYKYPTDGPGAADSGWVHENVFKKYKRRQESTYYNVVDWIFGADNFPESAEKMATEYPRPTGIRCDSSAIRKMAVGDDPRIIPFGELPFGWPETLDTERYESPGLSGGLVPDPLALSKHVEELTDEKQDEVRRDLTDFKSELSREKRTQSDELTQLTDIKSTLAAMAKARASTSSSFQEQQPGGHRKRAADHQSLLQDSSADGSDASGREGHADRVVRRSATTSYASTSTHATAFCS
jgi:hypothetical protein